MPGLQDGHGQAAAREEAQPVSDIVDWALRAARAGMHVFPCAGLSEAPEFQKRPVMTPRGRLKWGEFATTDETQVEDWWTHRCPDATAYGVACKPSRLLVVDLDMWKPGKKVPDRFQLPEECNGEDVFAAIVESLGVPYPFGTFAVATPTGGTHLYFRDPGVPLRNSALVAGFIDIRASGGTDGGYVLGPESVTSAGTYRVMWRNPIQPAPDWLIALCSPPPPRPPSPRPPGPSYSGPAKFDGLISAVRNEPAGGGNRNHKLYWAACAAAKDGMTFTDALRDLGAAALDSGLEEHETQQTIRSAYRGMGV